MNSKALWLFVALFLVLPLLSLFDGLLTGLDLFSRFYQAGSLVFGGGHVVLPLLQQLVGESLGADRFLSGYAAAQAVPGPMFTLAAFLGANLLADSPWLGALLATLGVFLPGLLLVLALQRHWEELANRPKMAGAIWGINAAVVGLLLSALYLPVFSSAVLSGFDMALVLMGVWALKQLKLSLLLIVAAYLLVGTMFF
jgi:chromate transporter